MSKVEELDDRAKMRRLVLLYIAADYVGDVLLCNTITDQLRVFCNGGPAREEIIRLCESTSEQSTL